MNRQRLYLVCGASIIALVTMAFLIAPTVGAKRSCVDGWWDWDNKADVKQCMDEKEQRARQYFADAAATQLAAPDVISIPATPNPTLFPPVLGSPDWVSKVRSVTAVDIGPIPQLRYSTSIWLVGGLEGENSHDYSSLFIYALSGTKGSIHLSSMALASRVIILTTRGKAHKILGQ